MLADPEAEASPLGPLPPYPPPPEPPGPPASLSLSEEAPPPPPKYLPTGPALFP